MTFKAVINRSLVLESRLTAIMKLCDRILSELQANNFDDDDIFAVHLALEEAFINAVKHGNKNQPDREVRVDYKIEPDKIEISIADEGQGFDPDSVPDPTVGENLYKPDGRGLLLMRSYMDVVDFNESGNCVQMVRFKNSRKLDEVGVDDNKQK